MGKDLHFPRLSREDGSATVTETFVRKLFTVWLEGFSPAVSFRKGDKNQINSRDENRDSQGSTQTFSGRL